jgi:Tol biopolymer transport system component
VETVAVARNGNRLAYAQVRHPGNIWQLELATQTKPATPATKLISSTRGEAGANLSPDGKHIAFQSWRSGSPEVWVCDRDASNPIQLTFFGGPHVGAPSWSPDSRRIVFDVRISGNAELYVVNLDGGPPKPFPTQTANASNPFWSADGQWIYFNTERPDAILKAPVGSGAAVRLSEGGGGSSPQESADGTRVFFFKVEAQHIRAWSASANGGDERPVTGMPADVGWVPAQEACISLMAPRATSSLTTSILSPSMSTRLRICLTCSPSGGPHSRPTATPFSSRESTTPRGTSFW